MTLSHAPVPPSPRSPTREVPELEAGDLLDQPTFHARCEAMPSSFRAELIGGKVHVPSPLKAAHALTHIKAGSWIDAYATSTPGTLPYDNATHILGEESEPQPDVSLRIVGGQTTLSEDGYIVGAPELVLEVASSTVSIDLHAKKQDYEQHGVQEYVAVVVRDERILWFVREGSALVEMPVGSDQIHRSRVFPGLWLDGTALLRGDSLRVTEVLKQGLATPEHAAFCATLAAKAASTGS